MNHDDQEAKKLKLGNFEDRRESNRADAVRVQVIASKQTAALTNRSFKFCWVRNPLDFSYDNHVHLVAIQNRTIVDYNVPTETGSVPWSY